MTILSLPLHDRFIFAIQRSCLNRIGPTEQWSYENAISWLVDSHRGFIHRLYLRKPRHLTEVHVDARNGEVDLQLIWSRIVLIEDLAPLAMDKVNSDAFQEAFKEPVGMVDKPAGSEPLHR